MTWRSTGSARGSGDEQRRRARGGTGRRHPAEAWQRVIDINLMLWCVSLTVFLPGLLEQGSGHIVNTASTAGLFPYGFDRLPYTTTKHAIVGLSESLAVYLRPRGIGVSCFCPAGVMTNIMEQITFYGDPRPPLGSRLRRCRRGHRRCARRRRCGRRSFPHRHHGCRAR